MVYNGTILVNPPKAISEMPKYPNIPYPANMTLPIAINAIGYAILLSSPAVTKLKQGPISHDLMTDLTGKLLEEVMASKANMKTFSVKNPIKRHTKI